LLLDRPLLFKSCSLHSLTFYKRSNNGPHANERFGSRINGQANVMEWFQSPLTIITIFIYRDVSMSDFTWFVYIFLSINNYKSNKRIGTVLIALLSFYGLVCTSVKREIAVWPRTLLLVSWGNKAKGEMVKQWQRSDRRDEEYNLRLRSRKAYVVLTMHTWLDSVILVLSGAFYTTNENNLRELGDFSIQQCGVCGTKIVVSFMRHRHGDIDFVRYQDLD
jgi:hypothetical protein